MSTLKFPIMKALGFALEDTRVLGYTFTMVHMLGVSILSPRLFTPGFMPWYPSVGLPPFPPAPRPPSMPDRKSVV